MTARQRLARPLGGGGRHLRRRTAVGVGAVTTLVVFVFGIASWLLFAHSLRATVDDDLRSVANTISARQPDDVLVAAGENERVGEFDQLPTGGDRPPVPYIEVLAPDGTQVVGALPVTDAAVAAATGDGGQVLETLDVDGRYIRMLTVPADPDPDPDPDSDVGGGAVRVGIDMTNIVEGLRQARAGTVLAGLTAGLLAAAIAWLMAGRLIAPVTAVAAAADHLRRHQDLPDRLEGEGDDELGQLVRSFNALLDDLRESRESQRRLVADASHELRTPLTSLRVKTEFIQSSPELRTEERQRLLDGAVADLASLSELVSELVELAAEGATPERARLVDLADLVEGVVEQFRATSGRTVTVSTAPGMVETRPRQATRALNNLLVNAHKYSPSGEPISVTQDGPRIAVRDHGPGIPVDERDRVFDRFHRGAAHQSIDGSGLGLAIVESVATANDGATWVEDPPDAGPGVVVGFSVGPSPTGAD